MEPTLSGERTMEAAADGLTERMDAEVDGFALRLGADVDEVVDGKEDEAIYFQTELRDLNLVVDRSPTYMRNESFTFMGDKDLAMLEQQMAHLTPSPTSSTRRSSIASSDKPAGSAVGLDDPIAQVARTIFSAWDLTGDGVLTAEDIVKCSGLDETFASSLARMLKRDNEDEISCESLCECLRVLNEGDLEAKVQLFVRFVDVDGSGSLTYEEVKPYLAELGDRGAEFLGFGGDLEADAVEGQGQAGAGAEEKTGTLTTDDMLTLFRNSVCGDATIAIFCDHILLLLHARTPKEAAATLRRAHRQNSCSPLPPMPQSVSALGHALRHVEETSSKVYHAMTKERVFYYVLGLLQAMFWLINFFYYRSEGFPLSFCIAKGFGLNLRVGTLAMYFTMMRRTMGYLFTFETIRPLIPMGFNIQIHSYIGFCLVFHGLGHVCGHITFYLLHVQDGFAAAFTQKSVLRGDSYTAAASGDGVTGFALLGVLLAMTGTALLRGKSSAYYRVFFLAHFGYVLWPALIIMHVPRLWPFFVAITALLLLERGYDYFYMTLISTLSTSRPCSNGVTFLSVPRTKETYPGSYYRIKVPTISKTEWHPFSLASGVAFHHLTFFVASSGDWTRQLYALVADKELRDRTMIMVQGPFYGPAKTATHFSTHATVLVASGIGITPFFSVMATKVADEQSYEGARDLYMSMFQEQLSNRGGSINTTRALKNMSTAAKGMVGDDVQVLRVVWMIRDCGELLFYLDYVYQLVKNQHHLGRHVVYVDVYLTGLGKSSDPAKMVSQMLFMLAASDKTSKYMNIHFGRPDMSRILKGVKPDNVYYCGGLGMQNVLAGICREEGAQFHPEVYDTGTAFVQGVEQYFASWRRKTAAVQQQKKRMQRKQSMLVPELPTTAAVPDKA